jgi:hypothetical protein
LRRSNAIRRRLAAIAAATRARVRHREGLRDRAKTARAIRLAALRAKIDPRQIRGLERLAYTQSELARLGDTPATRCADARFIAQDAELASRQTWEAKIADRVPRFGREPPHGRSVSLDDWYAWALAQQRSHPEHIRTGRATATVQASKGQGTRWKRRLPFKTLRQALERMRDGPSGRFALFAQRSRRVP